MSEPHILDVDAGIAGYPDPLKERETALLVNRRKRAEDDSIPQDGTKPFGIGLSGGGIRSATFCLGFFQSLASTGMLPKVDYLSTVSGGGYFGGFLGALFAHGKNMCEVSEILGRQIGSGQSPNLKHLRENGNYLAPAGAGDLLLATGVVIRNLFAIHLILVAFILMFFFFAQALEFTVCAVFDSHGWAGGWFAFHADAAHTAVSPWLVVPLISLIAAVIPLGFCYWFFDWPRLGRCSEYGSGSLLMSVIGLAGCALISDGLIYGGLCIVVVSIAALIWRTLISFKALPLSVNTQSPSDVKQGQDEYRFRREVASKWFTRALFLTLGFLAFAGIDSLGRWIHWLLEQPNALWGWMVTVSGGALSLLVFGKNIAEFFGNGGRPKLPLAVLATVGALALAAVWLVTMSALSYKVSWSLGTPKTVSAAVTSQTTSGSAPMGCACVKAAMTAIKSTDTRKAPVCPVLEDNPYAWLASVTGLLLSVILSWLLGMYYAFLNKSSLHALYYNRLTRAYLGAANAGRMGQVGVKRLRDAVAKDDFLMHQYWGVNPSSASAAAPVHIINVTINETVDGASNVQRQDRKGVGMAIGPCGLSVGVRHHLLLSGWGCGDQERKDAALVSDKGYQLFPKGEEVHRVFELAPNTFWNCERITIGQWLAISGAAFSTGIGARTTLGLSLLCGLANVRLGYWWDSGISRKAKPEIGWMFPIQRCLLSEFIARFTGTARKRWYLSDGGHFENLGGYELIRRRLPLILIVDAAQDAGYGFGDLAELVRKARVDFNTDIEFISEKSSGPDAMDDSDLAKPCSEKFKEWGCLDLLCPATRERHAQAGGEPRNNGPLSLRHLALAKVTYRDSSESGWLIYVKPTVTGDEPLDVLEYRKKHPDFPHQPTSDQFFDEAQWESYRRLGQHIGDETMPLLESLLKNLHTSEGKSNKESINKMRR